MKKRLFKEKTSKPSFWSRKTTVRSVTFAVVFVLLSPFLLVPNTAHAFSLDFGSLASGALDSAFKGATDYAAGSVFGYITSKLGPGFSSLVDQRQRWQGLYKPAMKEFMNEMDRQWVSSVPGFFTTTLFFPEAALGQYVGQGRPKSFQQEGHYAGLAQNAKQIIAYQENQSAVQSTYQEAQQDIEKATESEGINLLGSDNQTAKDITASQALDSAAAAVVVGGGGGGEGGGGTLETIESFARIASTVATVISLVI